MQQTRLVLELTNKCNLKCSYCFKRPNGVLPYKEKDIFNPELVYKYCEDKNIYGITLCGGEPLLRKDYVKDLSVKLKKYTNNICLATNGLLLDEKLIDFLNWNNIQVMISEHGAKKCDPELIKKIKRRTIQQVIQPGQLFGDEAKKLAESTDCRIDFCFDRENKKELTAEHLNILIKELRKIKPFDFRMYYRAIPCTFCNCCSNTYNWRSDNTLESIKDSYKIKDEIGIGCPAAVQNLSPTIGRAFHMIIKQVNTGDRTFFANDFLVYTYNDKEQKRLEGE